MLSVLLVLFFFPPNRLFDKGQRNGMIAKASLMISKSNIFLDNYVMDATTIIVMGIILNHSCVSFKLIILLNNNTNDSL